MTLYFSTHYEYSSNDTLTSAQENSRYEHIDGRLDDLEGHVADLMNPHSVDDSDVGCSPTSHTHTVVEHVGWYEGGTLSAGDLGAKPRVLSAATIASVIADVDTASSSGAVTIDILRSGDDGSTYSTIFSTKLTIDASESTSRTAATAYVLGTTSLNANDKLKVTIDDAGTGTAGLTLCLKLTRTVSQD